MIQNVEKQDNMKTQEGIGLYKIRYEMDVHGSSRDQNYLAGVIAYTSKEAVDTLNNFAKRNVKGYKGMKVDEVAFEGGCHAISDNVRTAIIATAVTEGVVVPIAEADKLPQVEGKVVTKKSAKKTGKKSIVPKQ